MIAFVSGRRTGKSETIISWLLEDPERRVIIVNDQRRVEHLLSIIGRKVRGRHGRKFWEERLLPYSRVRSALVGRGLPYREVAIDDLEEFLRQHFGKVDLVTMTATLIHDSSYTTDTDDYVDSYAWEGNKDGLDAARYALGEPRFKSSRESRVPELPQTPSGSDGS